MRSDKNLGCHLRPDHRRRAGRGGGLAEGEDHGGGREQLLRRFKPGLLEYRACRPSTQPLKRRRVPHQHVVGQKQGKTDRNFHTVKMANPSSCAQKRKSILTGDDHRRPESDTLLPAYDRVSQHIATNNLHNTD